jgi:hypothetical protein
MVVFEQKKRGCSLFSLRIAHREKVYYRKILFGRIYTTGKYILVDGRIFKKFLGVLLDYHVILSQDEFIQ